MLIKIQGRLGKVFLRKKKTLWLSPGIFHYTHPNPRHFSTRVSRHRVRPDLFAARDPVAPAQ
jgi:hypothetical protein